MCINVCVIAVLLYCVSFVVLCCEFAFGGRVCSSVSVYDLCMCLMLLLVVFACCVVRCVFVFVGGVSLF